MPYIIEHTADPDLAYSQVLGWVEEHWDTYSDAEQAQLALPVSGRWKRVAWQSDTPDNRAALLFESHRCWKCQDGARPCAERSPRQCGYLRARNE